MSRHPKIGFSTSTLAKSADIEALLQHKPQVIEICNIRTNEWTEVRKKLAGQKIPFGLHCPLPFNGWMTHFEISGPHIGRQEEAQNWVRNTLQVALDSGASYVLVHFPTVFTSHNTESDRSLSKEKYQDLVWESADWLQSQSQNYQVPLLLENVGPNPYFSTGEQFAEVLKAFPALKMCLDFGHIHVLPGKEDVYSFTEKVAPFVASVHVYNATQKNYRAGFHEPAHPDQLPKEGWMDLPRLIKTVLRNAPLEFFIFEYSFTKPEDRAQEGIDWLKEEIGRELASDNFLLQRKRK